MAWWLRFTAQHAASQQQANSKWSPHRTEHKAHRQRSCSSNSARPAAQCSCLLPAGSEAGAGSKAHVHSYAAANESTRSRSTTQASAYTIPQTTWVMRSWGAWHHRSLLSRLSSEKRVLWGWLCSWLSGRAQKLSVPRRDVFKALDMMVLMLCALLALCWCSSGALHGPRQPSSMW